MASNEASSSTTYHTLLQWGFLYPEQSLDSMTYCAAADKTCVLAEVYVGKILSPTAIFISPMRHVNMMAPDCPGPVREVVEKECVLQQFLSASDDAVNYDSTGEGGMQQHRGQLQLMGPNVSESTPQAALSVAAWLQSNDFSANPDLPHLDEDPPTAMEWKKDDVVAVRVTVGNWRRGRMTYVSKDGSTMTLLMLDTGDVINCHSHQIKQLPKNLAGKPFLAKKFKIVDIEPLEDNWSPAATKLVQDLVKSAAKVYMCVERLDDGDDIIRGDFLLNFNWARKNQTMRKYKLLLARRDSVVMSDILVEAEFATKSDKSYPSWMEDVVA